jgi:MinD-like ATPase involved in chromosome partitioning or flagellar assembly/CheY-like chemotaxis protein
MSRKIKVLAIDDDEKVLDIVRQTLTEDEFELRLETETRDGMREVLRFRPDLILLDYILPEISGMDALREMKEHNLTKDIPVIIMSTSNDPNVIEGFYQLGAIDFINKPIVPRILREKIRSIIGNLKIIERGIREEIDTQFIGFFGVKGGVGASTVAANTALFLAQSIADEGKRVLLMDNNCYYSSVRFFFDVKKADCLYHLLEENPFDLDEEFLFNRFTQVTDNLFVMPSIERMGQFELVREEEFAAVMYIISAHFDYILVDMDHSFSESNLFIMENASSILLITNTNMHSLQNLNNTVGTLKRIGIDRDKLALILNGVERGDKIDEEELMRFVGVVCLASFRSYPEKYEAAEESRIPVVALPRSPAAPEYKKFVQAIIEMTPAEIEASATC